ncbi:cytochrome P450 [Actinoalloteichus hymeniacidonis]|uniref:Cytochrome P450 n=1 Tax=Actinoalloteichus hymeniacidonis TaxID=340345 RepID=A0AAC9HRH0_9PSEU|nr:cytochrome P450 [Actinoalloteichus hymeniacidonis]AOS64222.1 cytochrome P450 [Actinoalloteichus hymeniacidonis]MBB5907710.1 cytochrome P450 [Actinoalloteichus hymeniacidonis]
MTPVEPSEPERGSPSACPVTGGRTPLYGPGFAADPSSVYASLRQYGPIAPVELAPQVPAWLVTGYSTALEILRDPETFHKDSRAWMAAAPPGTPLPGMMTYRPNCLYSGGAEHVRLRGTVTDSLNRVDPNVLREHVERHADELIDAFASRGSADLLDEYAKVLPLLVFKVLFGCPPELGDRMVLTMSKIFDGIDTEQTNADIVNCMLELIALKRSEPQADITSWLLAHTAELNDEEMIHQLVVLMGAGVEPTQNWIANGLRLLLSDDRFAGELSGGAVPVDDALVEVLWSDPPMSNFAITYPVEPVEKAGVRLRPEVPVVISLAAANADPALASHQRTGNRAHLAWSAGPHLCPAQAQARLIASVAIEKLLDRLPDIELAVADHELTWRPGPFHRALTALPVRFPPVSVGVAAAGTNPPVSGFAAPTLSRLPAATSEYVPSQVEQTEQPPRRGRWSFLTRWWRGT